MGRKGEGVRGGEGEKGREGGGEGEREGERERLTYFVQTHCNDYH